MKILACTLGALCLLGCGILDDGNRRYACRSNDDCNASNLCAGVAEYPFDRTCDGLFGGVIHDAGDGTFVVDGGLANAEGGIPVLEEDKCYVLYCLPENKNRCGDTDCPLDSECALGMDDHGSSYLACVDTDAVDDQKTCDDLYSACATDAICVLVFSRYVDKSTVQAAEAKRCVARTSVKPQ